MSTFLYKIYNWYSINKRSLPWRETKDPYKIWLSEIILQQTRVAQGAAYYQRFIESFPNVKELALADEDMVLKLWQGLGYYSRARNLYSTAKHIHYELDNKFPNTYKNILKLKGIGPYTAAAISSIAFNLPFPAVDGNVYRVFSRYFGINTPIDSGAGKKEFLIIANKLMPKKDAGMHNQALMEFGALQCIPKSPNCISCPVNTSCFAYNNKSVERFPVKRKKTKQATRFFYFFYFNDNEYTYLVKRTANDIWKNLYQFPMFESEKELNEIEIMDSSFIKNLNLYTGTIKIYGPKKHILSHQIIFAKLIEIKESENSHVSEQFIRINKKDIFTFAVSRLVELFLNDLDLINFKPC